MNKQQFNIQYFETILPNDIREALNYDLTVALKSIIEQSLEKRTGFLFDTTSVTVSVSKTVGLFRIKILTASYYKFLDEKYNLTQKFISSRAYRNAIKTFNELSQGKYDEYISYTEKTNPYV